MTSTGSPLARTLRQSLRWGLPAAGIAVVGWYVHSVGVDQLVVAVQMMGWGLAVLLVLPLYHYFLHTLGWAVTLSPTNRRRIGLTRLMVLQTFSSGISGMIPFNIFLSEPLKMGILRNCDYDREDFAASLLIDNAINGLAIFAIAAAGMIYLVVAMPVDRWLKLTALTLTLAMAAAGVILVKVQRWGLFTGGLVLVARLPGCRPVYERHHEMTERIDGTVRGFYEKNGRGFFLSLFLHVIERAHGVAELWLILNLLGTPAGWGASFFVFSVVTTLDNVLFFVQIGGMEVWVSTLLAWVGLARDNVNVTAALCRRVRFLFWAIVGLLLVVVTRPLFTPRRQRAELNAPG